ncbi:MAG: FHA domain-containing protein [Myxococcota bacterium]
MNVSKAEARSLSARIPELPGFCAEQIESSAEARTPAVLIDIFGRSHPLAKETPVGRDPGDGGMRIAESSVSRLHAWLRSVDGEWTVRDNGSTNGTYVDGQRIEEAEVLKDGDLVLFGDVGFVFAEHGRTAVLTDSYRRTAKAALRADEIRLVPAPADGGGLILRGGESMLLGLLQFSLLALLADTRREQAGYDENQRGFVSSVELQVRLPWDSSKPDGNHVKQLVRRARRSLAQLGLPEAIEARRRFGYRLTCDISMESTPDA